MRYRGIECLNCGHPLDLSDRYCPYCGQINTTKRLSLGDFFGEFILSVFTYDSRFRYTVKDLLFKPGTITRYYVEGKRFKYANPFRFFLSASILYFILLGVVEFIKGEENFNFDDGPVQVDTTGFTEDMEELNRDLSGIRDHTDSDSLQTAIEKKVNERIKNSISIKKTKDSIDASGPGYTLTPEDSLSGKGYLNSIFKKGELFYDFYDATGYTDSCNCFG